MKINYFENKSYSIAATTLAVVFLITTGIFAIRSGSINKDLNNTRITNEALISENLSFAKSTERLKSEVKSLQGQNTSLKNDLEGLNSQISNKESELGKLTRQNANVSLLNKKVKELELLKADQETKVAEILRNAEQLKQKNNQLTASLEELKKANEILKQNNRMLTSMEGNNYKVEALRGKKEYLTVKASRTKKILVSLDVPTADIHKIHFKVKTPDGKVYSSISDTNLSINIPDGYSNLSQKNPIKLNNEIIDMSRIELIMKPLEKLKKGMYSFDIYNDELYSGTTMVRLK